MLIVFSGPSGVGKGTILKKLMPQADLNLAYSVSMTTRLPRQGEVDGKDYFFVSEESFKQALKEDRLLESNCFADHYYGTPRDYVYEQLEKGHNIILEIDVNGALQVLKKEKDCLSVFILPPSIEELEERIRGRKSESEDSLNKRIATAREELKYADQYDYQVYNIDVDKAVARLREIFLTEMKKRNE